MMQYSHTANQAHDSTSAMMRNLALIFILTSAALPLQAEWAIDVHDPWIRHIPGGRPMAGYFTVSNRGDTERRLVGVVSADFGAVHMHESVDNDGTASMRPVDHVVVPAGGRVELRPGGYHLMLMKPQRELNVGDKVPMTLEFEDGGSQSAVFTIKPAWQE